MPSNGGVAGCVEALFMEMEKIVYVRDVRGLTDATIRNRQIGWDRQRNAYAIPIYDAAGKLVNVRYYQTKTATRKARRWGVTDHNEARLYPIDVLESATSLVICAGEWDALVLNQHGIPAITSTGGEGSWNPAWDELFRDKRVWVLYDCDEAGRAGAAKVAGHLTAVAKKLRVVDLDAKRADGFDVTDWFVKAKRTKKALVKLLNTAPPAEPAPPSALVWMSDVEEETQTWFWPGYLPDGSIAMFDGDPGVGKSVVTCDWTARASRGLPMYGQDAHNEPRTVLMVSGEDHLRKTMKPRLRAAGADMTKVASMALRKNAQGEPVPFSVPEDMDHLRAAMRESGSTFVVIDPVSSFISERINSHNDASIRKALLPLTMLAQDTNSVFVLVRHLIKDDRVTKALYRGGGSIGFSGNARSVLIMAEHPEHRGKRDLFVLAQTKANLAKQGDAPSITVQIGSWEQDDKIAVLNYLGHCEYTADDLLARPDSRKDAPVLEEAKALMKELLEEGPRSADEVFDILSKAGIKEKTARRAKEALAIKSVRVRDKTTGKTEQWMWDLPGPPKTPGAHTPTEGI